jgi:hypothetical protein
MVMEMGDLNLVAMNNETIVGLKGQTMLETRSILSGSFQVQYLEDITSLTLTHNGVLVVSFQNDHVLMLSKEEDEDSWRVTKEIAKRAKLVDSNGEDVVLWTGTDIHLYSQQWLEHITSLQNIASIKLSQDGNHIVMATDDAQLRFFRKENGKWVTQQSIWYKTDMAEDGREIEEEEAGSDRDTEVAVSYDGSVVVIQTSNGHLLLYGLYRHHERKKPGSGGQMDASLVSVFNSGERVAAATRIGTVLVLERKQDGMEVVAEITANGDIRVLNFQEEDQFQVIVGDTMTMYESQCAAFVSD